MDYGVFIWTASGIYRPESALYTYKLESAAERKARQLYESGINAVVRPMS